MNAIIIFIQKAIGQGIGILFGANGEILTEKSGNLNLGVPGMMYMGGIAGLSAAFLYENAVANPLPVVGFMLSILASALAGALGGLIYSFLTTSLRANQNVTGLALTTFGVGVGNFFGGSLSKLSGGVGQISVATTAGAFRERIPLLKDIPILGDVLFSYGFLTYFSIALSIYLAWYINRTRRGLNPVCAAPEVHGVQIHFQNFILAVGALDLERQPDLLELAPHRLFCAQVRELGQLLRDGAGSLGKRSGDQVAAQRAENAVDVDAAVLVKAQVLRGDERQLRLPRNLLQRVERAVFRAAYLGDQRVAAVIYAGGLRQRMKLLRIKPLPVRHVKDDHKARGKQQKDGERNARRD